MAFLLHHLLSESAARHPDATAVSFEGQTITYARLEKEANKLAHELLRLGVEKGDRVGIHMKRGIGSIIAACGILKAGVAYVPIDPLSLNAAQPIVTKCRCVLVRFGRGFARGPGVSSRSPLESIVVIDDADGLAGAPARLGLSTGRTSQRGLAGAPRRQRHRLRTWPTSSSPRVRQEAQR
jgi:non-ribosomal peptide synthetase component F